MVVETSVLCLGHLVTLCNLLFFIILLSIYYSYCRGLNTSEQWSYPPLPLISDCSRHLCNTNTHAFFLHSLTLDLTSTIIFTCTLLLVWSILLYFQFPITMTCCSKHIIKRHVCHLNDFHLLSFIVDVICSRTQSSLMLDNVQKRVCRSLLFLNKSC